MKKIAAAMFLAMGMSLTSCIDVKTDDSKLSDELSNELKEVFEESADGQKLVTQDVSVKAFEQVSIRGSFNVHYQQGEQQKVTVKGRVRDLKRMVVTSDGKTLKIKTKSLSRNLKGMLGNSMKEVDVFITSPDLTHVALAGSGEFDAKGMVDTDNLTLSLAGSGDIDFEQVLCDNLKVEIAGSGDVEMKSVDVNKVNLEIAGSGDMDIHFVRADHVSAEIAGSGDIELSGSVKKLDKRVAGSGSVVLKD